MVLGVLVGFGGTARERAQCETEIIAGAFRNAVVN